MTDPSHSESRGIKGRFAMLARINAWLPFFAAFTFAVGTLYLMTSGYVVEAKEDMTEDAQKRSEKMPKKSKLREMLDQKEPKKPAPKEIPGLLRGQIIHMEKPTDRPVDGSFEGEAPLSVSVGGPGSTRPTIPADTIGNSVGRPVLGFVDTVTSGVPFTKRPESVWVTIFRNDILASLSCPAPTHSQCKEMWEVGTDGRVQNKGGTCYGQWSRSYFSSEPSLNDQGAAFEAAGDNEQAVDAYGRAAAILGAVYAPPGAKCMLSVLIPYARVLNKAHRTNDAQEIQRQITAIQNNRAPERLILSPN